MKGRHRGIEYDEPKYKFGNYKTYNEPKKSGREENVQRFNNHRKSFTQKHPPTDSLAKRAFETTKEALLVCGLVVTAPIWAPIVGAKIIVEDVLGMK